MPYDLIVKIALGIVALGMVWGAAAWAVHKLGRAAVDKDDLQELQQLAKDQKDANQNRIRIARKLLDRYRRVRGDDQGGGDPAA